MISLEKAFVVDLINTKEITASGNETGVDMLAYDGYALAILDVAAVVGGSSPTLIVGIEESANNSDWTATDVVTFTTVTTTASKQSAIINLGSTARYLRAVTTVTGTPTRYTYGVTIVANKKIA